MRFFFVLICASWLCAASGAISVGPGGSGLLIFNTPPSPDEWSTLSVAGVATDITNVAGLDAAVQLLAASNIISALPTSNAIPPGSGSLAAWNSTALYLQTHPTGNRFTVLMATLRNDTESEANLLTINYDLSQWSTGGISENIPGHRLYYNLSGSVSNWLPIVSVGGGTAGTLTGTVNVGSWPTSSLLYLLWVDDNGPGTGNTEGAYSIDNVSFSATNEIVPVTISISAPTNNQAITAGRTFAINGNGSLSVTNVAFYADGILLGSDGTLPFVILASNLTA
ncbi:MAG TPA: Ig-like domain-containing protein, partial [Verrucomicrobiae bacterium]